MYNWLSHQTLFFSSPLPAQSPDLLHISLAHYIPNGDSDVYVIQLRDCYRQFFPKSSLCHKLTVKVTVQATYFRCSRYGRIIYKKVLFIRNFWNFFYERFNKRFQFSILVWGDLWFFDKKTKNISKYYLCIVLMKEKEIVHSLFIRLLFIVSGNWINYNLIYSTRIGCIKQAFKDCQK